MSNDTVKISPTGAFSHHWNQAIDNNKNFLVRLGKSVLEFIKATFCGYKVSAAMVTQYKTLCIVNAPLNHHSLC
jgi:hypothetical protein